MNCETKPRSIRWLETSICDKDSFLNMDLMDKLRGANPRLNQRLLTK